MTRRCTVSRDPFIGAVYSSVPKSDSNGSASPQSGLRQRVSEDELYKSRGVSDLLHSALAVKSIL